MKKFSKDLIGKKILIKEPTEEEKKSFPNYKTKFYTEHKNETAIITNIFEALTLFGGIQTLHVKFDNSEIETNINYYDKNIEIIN